MLVFFLDSTFDVSWSGYLPTTSVFYFWGV